MPLMDAIHWYAELTRLIIESTLWFLFFSFILSRGGKESTNIYIFVTEKHVEY